MRRALVFLAVLLATVGVAAADEWVGWLADEKCAAAGIRGGSAFQVLIRVRFQEQIPTKIDYVTHRVLSGWRLSSAEPQS